MMTATKTAEVIFSFTLSNTGDIRVKKRDEPDDEHDDDGDLIKQGLDESEREAQHLAHGSSLSSSPVLTAVECIIIPSVS